MKRYAEAGSPWRASLSSLNYWVVVPPFMPHDCWSCNKISIKVMKVFPKPNFFKTEIRKLWSRESKAFSWYQNCPAFAICPQSLAHCGNIGCQSIFCRCYLNSYPSVLVDLASFFYSRGRSFCYSNSLHDFSVNLS